MKIDNETKQKVWERAIEMVYSGRYDHWTGRQVREALEKEFRAEIVRAVLCPRGANRGSMPDNRQEVQEKEQPKDVRPKPNPRQWARWAGYDCGE